MKKNIIILLTIISMNSFGQDHYISLTFGLTKPLANFGGSSDPDSKGFALSGFAGDYSGAYFLTDYFGIGGDIKFTSNTLNETKLKDRLDEQLPPEFSGDLEYTYTLGIWKQVALLVGPQLTIPSDNLTLDIYALAGPNFVMTPDFEINAQVDETEFNRRLLSQDVSFGVDLGIGIRYHLSELYSVRIYSSYFISKAKGEIIKETLEENEELPVVEKTNFSLPIQSLNIGIGIVYRL
ncbi:MAG: outer membrane beta-barrel protein [Bacteroidales bacterium]|nr:outer membrane beta-barrel protein [Bacteroidales bacterium]